ncbi:MAG: type II CRISPR-associated endonuclease Cas1 [Erysipelotrichaceae bacterium]|nr:type II CRISPR-associated endonuclease Cas1 [Erysipelotrichaceae bacterium]
MSWRTVIISNTAKLDYKMDYMLIRQDKTTKIHLSEIAIVIIETTAVSMTACLLCELIKHKVKVIFCDEKRNPSSELIGYYGSHDTSAKIRDQIKWTDEVKTLVWMEIVAEKIRKQRDFLIELNKENEYALLDSYLKDIKYNDSSNREGHAAKVYFNAVFGNDFSRAADIPINAALNYGYGIILSAFNREIAINGYLTQMGLFHDNMFNQFNLGSDLMEPFRILIDRCVYNMALEKFDHDEKLEIVDVLNKEIMIDGKHNYLINAIKIYVRSVFDAISEHDVSLIRFYRNEL